MAKRKSSKKSQQATNASSREKTALSAGSPTVQKQPSWTRQVKEISGKYPEGLPKNLEKALDASRKELRRTRQPIYALNKKIKDAPSKYYKQKFKKEKAALITVLTPKLADLSERREDYKTIIKAKDEIRKEKKATQNKVYRLEKKLRKADEETDYDTFAKLAPEILKLQGNIDAMNVALGIEITKTPVEGYKPALKEDVQGFIEDPNNPYTIWDAMRQLDADLKQNLWKYFIINGNEIPADNIISIRHEAAAFWLIQKRPRTDTPKVNRYANMETRTVKYIPYQG